MSDRRIPRIADGGAPVTEAQRSHEAINAARKRLGRQLAAWRQRADLTQREVAYQTGYCRSAIAQAEGGEHASRDLVAAVDRALGAGGRFTSAHDSITAAVTAARIERARAARGRAATTAADGQPPPAQTTSTVESTCPACDRRLAVRVAVALLPAVPEASPSGPAGGAS